MTSTPGKRHRLQVNESTYQAVCEMAEASHTSMTNVVERAVDAYRNDMLLRTHNEAWVRLMQEDPGAIDEYMMVAALA